MATMTTDRLVEDYVRRLEDAAEHLPEERRTELVLEIREHIDHALSETGAHDEVAIRNALERLGPPGEIVAAAEPPTPAPPSQRDRSTRLEYAALIALVVPVFGWVIGLVLVVLSRLWSGREKAVGIALGMLPLLLSVVAGTGSVVPSSGDYLALLTILLAGVPSALYLGWRLSARAAAR
jgi:hypothetical protein